MRLPEKQEFLGNAKTESVQDLLNGKDVVPQMIVFYQIDGKGEWIEFDAGDSYSISSYDDRLDLVEACAFHYYSSESDFYFDVVVAKAPGGEVIARGEIEVEIELNVTLDEYGEEDDE